ncbi:MAG: iron-sulfur cluster assembly scaffold protein [Rhodobacteraceae bacterium]|nr:iron-sulfur cluster assembly scaffold protein [Paracoccaceae bacterium]
MTSVDEKVTKLYTQRILELASNIPLHNRLEDYEGSSKVRSPLCGSTVTVDLVLEDGLISEFGQDVKACALGQATASIVGSRIIGRSFNEVSMARDQMEAMLKKRGDPPGPPFEELEILYPAQDYKNRHASILLVFDATLNAMEQALDKDNHKSLN